jgi:hypothetical protein
MLQTLLNGQTEGVRKVVRAVCQQKGLVGFFCTPFEDRGICFSWIEIDHFREADWE